MPRERSYRVEAIVLKRTNTGEADRLLTLYTSDLGKLRAIAKGARKPSSRKSGHVELFTHTALLLARGRHLDVVTQAETINAFRPLQKNLERLGYAYYLAELVDRFVEEAIENRPLFDLLLNALKWLGEDESEPLNLARYFELHLLQHVGYRPQLFHCVNCGEEIQPIENFFSIEAGGVIDPSCMQTQREKLPGHGRDAVPVSLNALKLLRYLQTREWVTVRSIKLNVDAHTEVEALMERYIRHYLERNLKSVEFLKELRQASFAEAR